jgi:hypothetical protein
VNNSSPIQVVTPGPALRRRRHGEAAPSGEAASWLHWKGKVSVLRLSAYILPAASRDTARRARAQACQWELETPRKLPVLLPPGHHHDDASGELDDHDNIDGIYCQSRVRGSFSRPPRPGRRPCRRAAFNVQLRPARQIAGLPLRFTSMADSDPRPASRCQ